MNEARGVPQSVLPQITILLFVALATALFTNTIHPYRIPLIGDWANHVATKATEAGMQVVHAAGAKGMVEEGWTMILDARPLGDYDQGHLPGALSFPANDIESAFEQTLPILSQEDPILIYCFGRSCDESLQVADFLKDQGYTNLFLFAGGMEDWNVAGYDLEGAR